MSRTWRRGLLLTSRNHVGFPDWVSWSCWLSFFVYLFWWWTAERVGGATPARCKAALLPLAESCHYISSLTNNVRVRGAFRALTGQRSTQEHPLERLREEAWSTANLRVCMFEFGFCILYRFILLAWTQACQVWGHATWFCLIWAAIRFSLAFQWIYQPHASLQV